MLTQRQRDLLEFINKEAKIGVSPSYEEMGAALGIRSKSSTSRLVQALVDRGYLHHRRGRVRSLTVLRLPGQEGIIAELIDALVECITDRPGAEGTDFHPSLDTIRRAREVIEKARKLTSAGG